MELHRKQKSMFDQDELRNSIPALIKAIPQVFAARDVDYYVNYLRDELRKHQNLAILPALGLISGLQSTGDEIKRNNHFAKKSMRRKQIKNLLGSANRALREIKARTDILDMQNEKLRKAFWSDYDRVYVEIAAFKPFGIFEFLLIVIVSILLGYAFKRDALLFAQPIILVLNFLSELLSTILL